ncbi:hypothetical protein IU450_32375 [Nocardia abscessus]|uniref:hypothetical protein n=1 Tax=Nocardia abscessus TaxID=120957 RepID=UPI001894F55D|nr:hypothetical protein [Nocardia abscessus]MBF6340556.1 hypothetical protein [Nocardia abscessus]
MYPSQSVAPEGPRHVAGPSVPHLRAPRAAGTNHPAHPHAAPSNALASFVTYVKALESLDKNRFPDEYAVHSHRIKELKPFLRAHGILDVMAIKNPEVAALIGA